MAKRYRGLQLKITRLCVYQPAHLSKFHTNTRTTHNILLSIAYNYKQVRAIDLKRFYYQYFWHGRGSLLLIFEKVSHTAVHLLPCQFRDLWIKTLKFFSFSGRAQMGFILTKRNLGWAAILAVLLVYPQLTGAAPANNSTGITSPNDALLTSDAKVVEDVDEKLLCNSQDTEIDCNQTEYSEYMQCVEKKRTIRRKRQTACSNIEKRSVPASLPVAAEVSVVSTPLVSQPQDLSTLSECEFNRQKCIVGCQGNSKCVLGCPAICSDSSSSASLVASSSTISGSSCPPAYHNCIANCMPGQPCEILCKSLCTVAAPALGYKTVIFQGQNGEESDRVQVPIGIGHNITTIIKLNNYINTTNHINIPTNITNTNINKIDLTSTSKGGLYNLGQTKEGSCCFAVQPKSCRTSTSGLRCHHRRHKTCGSQCTSRVIHAQSRRNCSRRGRCSTKMTYVAEPNSKCHYAHQWPYVSCGMQSQRRCEGCYEHYDHQQSYYYQPQVPQRCMACYDGGFDSGPRYRQGPVYRPNYYHEPPCYLTGSCYGQMGGGYGGYGYYPPPMYNPYPPQYPMEGEGEEGHGDKGHDELFPGDDEYSGQEPVEDVESFDEKEWDQVVQKCKVVNVDENTVIIKNCTTNDLGSNPYAASKVGADKEASAVPPHMDHGDDMGGMAPPPPPYYPYGQPYYYNYPPPPPPQPYGYQPYGYYGGQMPPPQYNQQRGGEESSRDVLRPYYYDNYGEDDSFVQEEDPFAKASEEGAFAHDEEKDLISKGFEKVDEKLL